MIVHECRQGSDEWHRLRLGIPTASGFARLVTPKTGKASAQAFGYLCECFAEYGIGGPLDESSSLWMDRGRDLEERAIAWYEFDRGCDVRRVGFVTDDGATVGCSPDGLVGDDGGLEIKVPAAKTHVSYLLRPSTLPNAYRMQIQGGLWICGRQWWDIVSYNPAMPAVVVRVERDEELIDKLADATEAFAVELDAALVKFGYKESEQESKNGNEGNEGVRHLRDDEGSRDVSALIATS